MDSERWNIQKLAAKKDRKISLFGMMHKWRKKIKWETDWLVFTQKMK